MLKYFYTSQYTSTSRGHLSEPEFAVSIYAIADKYSFDPLRKVAIRVLSETCDPAQNPADFIAAIYAIDTNTAPNDLSLWNIVIPKIKAAISVLCESPDFLKMITRDIPDLAVVLLRSLDKSSVAVFRSTPFELGSGGNEGKGGEWEGEEEQRVVDYETGVSDDENGENPVELIDAAPHLERLFLGRGHRLGGA